MSSEVVEAPADQHDAVATTMENTSNNIPAATDVIDVLEALKAKVFAKKRFTDYITLNAMKPYSFEEGNNGTCFTTEVAERGSDGIVLPYTIRNMEVLPNLPEGFGSVRGDAECFVVMTLFAERGGFSGHVYQPLVNHRMMNFSSFTESHIDGSRPENPPLIDSMVHPYPGCSFSVGNFMSFFCYEIVQSEDVNLPCIFSPAALLLKDDEQRVDFQGNGHIKGCRAQIISVEGWLRTLKVFGLDRNPAYAAEYVSASEAAAFFELLGSHNLSSLDGLSSFIAKHQMEWLYSVNADPLVDQLNNFFSLVRGVMPLRLGAYDGRHRYNLCCYFATGYFEPSPGIRMPRQSFEEMEFPDYESEKASLARCAVFQRQVFYLSQPEPSEDKSVMDMSTALAKLRKSGIATTHNATLSVEASWTTLIPEFVEFLISSGVGSTLEVYKYDNFWEPPGASGAVEILLHTPKRGKGKRPNQTGFKKSGKRLRNTVLKNSEILFSAFRQFVAEASDTREKLVIGRTNQTISQVFQLLQPVDNDKPFALKLGLRQEVSPPKHTPRDLATFIFILKLCSDDMNSIVRLRDLVALRPSQKPQLAWADGAKVYFRSIDFLRYWVWGVSNIVANHLVQRYIVDKAVIVELLKAERDADLEQDLAEAHELVNPDVGTYPLAEKAGLFNGILTIVKAGKTKARKKGDSTEDGNFTDKDLFLPVKATKMTAKLTFACQAVIIRDIIEAVIEYGRNPKIELSGNSNHMLQLYISGFEFYDEPIAVYPPARVPMVPSLDRNSLLILLELYKEHIVRVVPLGTMAVFGLQKMMPLTKHLNQGSKKAYGFTAEGSVLETSVGMQGLDSIVDSSWKFSSFVRGVMDGKVNLDEIAPFKKHMGGHFKKMLAVHKIKVEDALPESFTAKYQAPVHKHSIGHQQKTKVDHGAKLFAKVVQRAYNFEDTTCGDVTEDGDEVLHMSEEDLGTMFGSLLEASMVKSVKFDMEGLVAMYDVHGEVPDLEGGDELKAYVLKLLEEKKKRKSKKGESASPKRPAKKANTSAAKDKASTNVAKGNPGKGARR